jgi:hypothetical protein
LEGKRAESSKLKAESWRQKSWKGRRLEEKIMPRTHTDTHRHKKEVKVGGERAEGSKLTAQRRESKKTG